MTSGLPAILRVFTISRVRSRIFDIQENYEIFKGSIQTVGLTRFTVCSEDSKKKSSENDQTTGHFQSFFSFSHPRHLIWKKSRKSTNKKFWPYLNSKWNNKIPQTISMLSWQLPSKTFCLSFDHDWIEDLTCVRMYYWIYQTRWVKEIKCEACRAF